MKKIVFALLFLFSATFSLASCGGNKEPVDSSYIVTFDGNGGTLVSGTEVQTVKSPSEIVAPLYEKKDYNFTGWDKDITTITATTTVYAQWEYYPEDDTNLEIDEFIKQGNKLSSKTDNDVTTFSFSDIVHVAKGTTWKLYSDIRGQEEIITKTIDLNIGDNTVYINVTARSGRNELYTIVVRRLNMFTISWVDEDGTTPLSTTYVQEDDTPEYDKETPTKPSTAQYSYPFAGWVPSIVKASGDTTYKASYTPTVNKYTITWKNYDGKILETDEDVEYGNKPIYDRENPTKPKDAKYTYTFTGWDKDINKGIEGNTTFIAQYSNTLNKYTVTWKNYDGKVLETDENVSYGTVPSYDGETPSKPKNAQYTYNFFGWSPVVTTVTGDTTYVAQYKQELVKFNITWKTYDDEVEVSVPYGITPSYSGTPTKVINNHSFEWLGWDKEVLPATQDEAYKAVFDNDITFDFEGIRCTINGKTKFTDVYIFDESEEPVSINYIIKKPIGSYTLPDTISVYVDNNLVTSGYNYDKSTGAFSIASNLGNIRLEVTGVKI